MGSGEGVGGMGAQREIRQCEIKKFIYPSVRANIIPSSTEKKTRVYTSARPKRPATKLLIEHILSVFPFYTSRVSKIHLYNKKISQKGKKIKK